MNPYKATRLVAFLTLALLLTPRATAQAPLQGGWVDAAQDRIEDIRKTEVRLIVLDAAGNPVPNANVHIDQQRHAFPLGFTLVEDQWPEALPSGAPLWRCFNAIALDALTDWSAMSSRHDAPPNVEPIEQIVRRAQRTGITARFGGLISADRARNPAWLAELDKPALREAFDRRLSEALRGVLGPFTQYDLYTHALDHDDIEQTFGTPALRALYDRAQALAPDASIGLRVRDSLLGGRMRQMARRITTMRLDFIPFDYIAIEPRMTRQLVQAPLQRTFDQLEELNANVTLVGVEMGGRSEAAAAYNLEVLLRTAFASSSVQGIWLGPLTAEQTTAEHAALLDDEGNPTPPGEVVDRLFHETWRTDHRAATDALGNVRASIFAGVHDITAELPNGETLAMTVRVAPNDDERVIVLEPGESF
ncbi:MAG: hypothetical protein ACODAQ_04560 [Phycisphaeraceae bacterium]